MVTQVLYLQKFFEAHFESITTESLPKDGLLVKTILFQGNNTREGNCALHKFQPWVSHFEKPSFSAAIFDMIRRRLNQNSRFSSKQNYFLLELDLHNHISAT